MVQSSLCTPHSGRARSAPPPSGTYLVLVPAGAAFLSAFFVSPHAFFRWLPYGRRSHISHQRRAQSPTDLVHYPGAHGRRPGYSQRDTDSERSPGPHIDLLTFDDLSVQVFPRLYPVYKLYFCFGAVQMSLCAQKAKSLRLYEPLVSGTPFYLSSRFLSDPAGNRCGCHTLLTS